MLVAIPEFMQMTTGILNGQRTLVALKTTCEETANHLDHYWRTQPDLPTAARAAVHDAARFHRIAERCLLEVDAAITAMQSLANLTDGGCDAQEAEVAVLPIINDTANKLGEALAFIREQMALPLPPETNPGIDLGPKFPAKP